ncbi:MAG: hypothetical protein HYZ57_01410 [Acidobacteria bacterium]|nr:hypothetical protein [Acidobacteriota bacterium]
MRLASALTVLAILWPGNLGAEEKNRLPVTIHGFLMGNASVRMTGKRPLMGEGGAFVLGEERLRLDASGATKSGNGFLLIKGDIFHDAVANRVDGDLREAYAGFRGSRFDLRLGRQIVTWGVGDLFFINDVFPKDWESFFSGRPMEYLKRGVDAVRLQYSSDALNVDVVATPFFTADALPSPKRFFLYNPFAAVAEQRQHTPPVRAENTEVALRLYRRIAGLDVSLYGHHGFWRMPGANMDSDNGTPRISRFYPRLVTWGASAQRNLLDGIVSFEGGRYNSLDDRGGAAPGVPNSQWRVLAAYQRQLARELTATFQGYVEAMESYNSYRNSLPAGFRAEDRVRGVFSVRLTQFLSYQNWRLSAFIACSPTDSDCFAQPEVSHRLSDKLSAALGANIFTGKHETTFFGQMAKNDNVYTSLRFDF